MSKDRKTYLQFKPMADDLRQAESWCDLDGVLNRTKTMQNLYKIGYRKLREGEWELHKPRIENRNATYKCSACGNLCSSYYNDVGAWNYCPHCGAKMV